eukprot:260410-Rhodomonas_salina.1
MVPVPGIHSNTPGTMYPGVPGYPGTRVFTRPSRGSNFSAVSNITWWGKPSKRCRGGCSCVKNLSGFSRSQQPGVTSVPVTMLLCVSYPGTVQSDRTPPGNTRGGINLPLPG